MTLQLMPNVLTLLASFIPDDADMAPLVDRRVYADLPAGEKVWPAIRTTRIGGSPASSAPYFLDRPLVQIEAWAPKRIDAWRTAETCRASLSTRLTGAHNVAGDLVVVDGVDIGGIREDIDEDHSPVLHRAHFDAVIYTHPG